MATEPLERKLAAILYADVAGYARLTGEDEDATHRTLSAYLDLISGTVEDHRGRVMHYAGDAVLAKFNAVVDALSCAVAIQTDLRTRNQDLPDERRVQFRIGVNLGDVIEDRGDIYGDGVNVAARLESLAEPGGICISESVRTAIGKKLALDYESMGEQRVKNIEEPVRAYRVCVEAQAASSSSTPSPGVSAKPSLAVLPFTNMSGDPEQEYFSDGITEDLITALSHVRSFQVTSRHSVFLYKNRDIDVKTMGQELGARYIIEGSVRRAADRMRVSASLSDTTSGRTVWAQHFDGSPQDIFDFQDQMTQAIVGAVGPQLSRAEADRTLQKHPESLDAYEHVLRALALNDKRTEADSKIALDHCYKAIDLDPTYARAYAFASWCYRRRVQLRGMVLSDEECAECMRLMEEALRLDRQDPVVLWQTALSVAYVQGDLERALDLMNRSIDMDPHSTRAYKARGSIFFLRGMPEEAIADSEHAQKLDAKDLSMWVAYSILAIAYFQLDRYDDCITWARRALAENSAHMGVQLVLAASLSLTGEVDEAHAFIRGWKTEDPELSVTQLEKRFRIDRYPNLKSFRNALQKTGLKK